MKRLAALLLIGITLPIFANGPIATDFGRSVTFKVSWEFQNISEGYDHDTRCEVYIDGTLMATSSITKQSKPNSVSLSVSKGFHTVKVVNYALYEGNWEAHTIENNYSIDCQYIETMEFKKGKKNLNLIFDINSGTSVAPEDK